ncbi:MAG: hypothetical protein B2I17_06045 [Thermoplasmatales archaeon B_DKE]|nr:MAG: hypothetical protein B2I17_06045 [Thermoplasmatales archaeon B_DKE]
MRYLSHLSESIGGQVFPEKLLQDHLFGVAQNAFSYVNEQSLFKDDEMEKCAFIEGACHDFGKYTTYFQKYLKGKNVHRSSLSNHALISAVFGAYSVLELIGENEAKMAFLVFMAISHHHGNLISPLHFFGKHDINSPDEIMNDVIRTRVENLETQVKNMITNKEQIQEEIASIFTKSGIIWKKNYPSVENFLQGEWKWTINRIIKVARNLNQGFIHDGNELATYFRLLILYSSLLDSDKRDAGRIPNTRIRYEIPANVVTSRISELSSSSGNYALKQLRHNLFHQVSENVNNIDLGHHILTLTAPTGTGKTLSAMYAALRLRERIAKSMGKTSRIIYCLPYTSIIDQNYTVIEGLLTDIPDFKITPARYLLKHHHLSDVDTGFTDEGIPVEMALSLIESWDSEVIVTTFVQMFESLIGNRNKFLRKVHRISNSIIILDEIQSLNVEFWPVIAETLKQASNLLNCYFILLTATQPLIFRPEDKIEIGFGSGSSGLSRTYLSFLRERMTEEDADNIVVQSSERVNSILVIRNTIKLSVNMFNRLQGKLVDKQKEIKLYYLSANLIPKDRVKRVKEIKASLESGEKIIVVSTQVVEAGIDLDFGAVFRDLGPVDSIIQATGRCNRNNLAPMPGEVVIINPVGDDSGWNKNYSKSAAAVYGSVHMDIAYEIMNSIGTIKDEQYNLLLSEYYEKIRVRGDINEPVYNHELFNNMAKLNFDTVDETDVKSFSVIENKRPMVNLFIAKDDECIGLLDWYKNKILTNENPVSRKIEFLRERANFNSCIISVDKKRAMESGAQPITEDNNTYVLESVLCNISYDVDTGLKKLDETFLAL